MSFIVLIHIFSFIVLVGLHFHSSNLHFHRTNIHFLKHNNLAVQVLAIDGKDTAGWTGQMASQNLRGLGGSKVRHH